MRIKSKFINYESDRRVGLGAKHTGGDETTPSELGEVSDSGEAWPGDEGERRV